MAKSALPVIPRVVFGVVEPAMLMPRQPRRLLRRASPALPALPALPPQALVLLLQLTNVFLLLAGLAVLCSWTAHASVARWYLVAVALADYGHVWACYRGVGARVFWDTAAWNDMLWGAVAGSAALNVLRWATLLGAFGRVRGPRGPPAPEGA
ncbi:hypothetical protein F4781DRAFT_435877 [Annulohypoxylon bovei var. microspora]|nr:hypothetical protein F4781DRAFT_435877 [Annulohypoxylon bovei var. microspora]